MNSLLETIQILKNNHTNSPVLYKMYEDGELVYVGIGGKSNRKGWQRLYEHYKATMPSSLKWKILKNKWIEGKSFEEAESYWLSLKWEHEVGDIDYILNLEKQLIKKYQPKYNIEFK